MTIRRNPRKPNMNIETRLLPRENAYILQNMYPAYIHDLSAFQDKLPNRYGLFEADDVAVYERETFLAEWWQSGAVSPFVIWADERPAGFALVAGKPFVQIADYSMHEFFLRHPYRGKGIGKQAAKTIFSRLPGLWKAEVLPRNLPAQGFWRRVIGEVTDNLFTEAEEGLPNDRMHVFRFTISQRT